MRSQNATRNNNSYIGAALAFIIVFVVIDLIALTNAPIKTNPRIANDFSLYLAEVRNTGIPFMILVSVIAAILGGYTARLVYQARGNSRKQREMIAGYAFLAPYIIITLTFTLGVLLFALYVSFTDYSIFTEPKWLGLDNYLRAFQEQTFQQALHNVLWYAVIVVPTQTALAILLAVLLNAPMRFKQFFRTIFYAPSVTSSVVITSIFIWLYLKTGYLNFVLEQGLGLFGIPWEGINWLGDPRGLIQLIASGLGVEIPSDLWYLRGPSIAWMAIMVQNIFTTAPTFMIMFLAALQDINPAIYEAASIDGANGWQKFWSITLPMLRPIILLVSVLGTIGTLQIFDQVYLATAGGPLGTTNTPVYEVFTRALGKLGPIEMGYGSALAFILFAIIFVFTFIQRRFLERGTELY